MSQNTNTNNRDSTNTSTPILHRSRKMAARLSSHVFDSLEMAFKELPRGHEEYKREFEDNLTSFIYDEMTEMINEITNKITK